MLLSWRTTDVYLKEAPDHKGCRYCCRGFSSRALLELQDVSKTLSQPHFIFSEWNQMWRFFIVFSFGQPLWTHDNFAFPLEISCIYSFGGVGDILFTLPQQMSPAFPRRQRNCWVIDCKTGIISALAFDPIKRRRCRRTGVCLSPSVSWSFLLHHNIQPPPKEAN